MFILVISSGRFEGIYQICFLIDSAFGKWQYFICSLPLSVQTGVPISILTGVLAVKYFTLCATGVMTSQRQV